MYYLNKPLLSTIFTTLVIFSGLAIAAPKPTTVTDNNVENAGVVIGDLANSINTANASSGSGINFGINNQTVNYNAGPMPDIINLPLIISRNAQTNLILLTTAPQLFNVIGSITAGTLTLADMLSGGVGPTLQSNVNVASGSTVAFVESLAGTYNYNSVIGGAGGLKFSGGAGFTYNFNNSSHTYTGPTTVDASTTAKLKFASGVNNSGALTLGSNANLTIFSGTLNLSGPTTISSGATLTINNLDSGTVSLLGSISGSGALVLTGTGNAFLGGINIFSGGTTITSGMTATAGTGTNSAFGIGNLANNGTLIISNHQTIGGSYTQGSGAILNPIITSNASFGSLNVSNTATINGGGTINVALASNYTVALNDTYTLISATNPLGFSLSSINLNLPVIGNNLMFVPSIVGNNLQLSVAQINLQTSSGASLVSGSGGRLIVSGMTSNPPFEDDPAVRADPVAFEVARELDQIRLGSPNHDIVAFLQELADESGESLVDSLKSLVHYPSGGGVSAVLNGIDQAVTKIEKHLYALRADANPSLLKSSYVAGDRLRDSSDACISFGPIVFGNTQKQKKLNGINGYRANTAGLGFIGDIDIADCTENADHLILGAGLLYINSNAHSLLTTKNKEKIRNTQGILYAAWDNSALFADVVLGGGYSFYREKRIAMAPPITQHVTSKAHGYQFNAKIRTGYEFDMFNCSKFVPMISLQEFYLHKGGAIDNGATLNNRISAKNISALQAAIGASYFYTTYCDIFTPEVHAFYRHYIRRANADITAQFIEAGGPFLLTGLKPPRGSVDLGATLKALLCEDLFLIAEYDIEFKKRYLGQTAALKLRWVF